MNRRLLIVAAGLLSGSFTARADTFYYTFTGLETGGRTDTVTFSVPSSGPFSEGLDDFYTPFDTVTFNGVSSYSSQNFTYPALLAIIADASGFKLFFNGDLYTDSASGPILETGSFTLNLGETAMFSELNSFTYVSGVLDVSTTPPTSGVPEPSTLALFGLTLGLLSPGRKFSASGQRLFN